MIARVWGAERFSAGRAEPLGRAVKETVRCSGCPAVRASIVEARSKFRCKRAESVECKLPDRGVDSSTATPSVAVCRSGLALPHCGQNLDRSLSCLPQ